LTLLGTGYETRLRQNDVDFLPRLRRDEVHNSTQSGPTTLRSIQWVIGLWTINLNSRRPAGWVRRVRAGLDGFAELRQEMGECTSGSSCPYEERC